MNGKITVSLLSLIMFFWALQARSSINEELDRVLFDTLSKFRYVNDDIQYGRDLRISFAEEVKKGQEFWGDCDDFAYTIRDLLREKGYKVETVIVRTSAWSGNMIHMVVKVDDKYMLDNRYPFVRTWDRGMRGSQYELIK